MNRMTMIGIAALGWLWWWQRKGYLKPVAGVITSGFGKRIHPITGEEHDHNGVDIGAPHGTPVVAPYDGEVTGMNYTERGGNQLFILHTDGRKTGYAHLKDTIVIKGQKVRRGDVVAHVGSTGMSTGPHLHYTIRNEDGEFIDPETTFPADA